MRNSASGGVLLSFDDRLPFVDTLSFNDSLSMHGFTPELSGPTFKKMARPAKMSPNQMLVAKMLRL